MVVFLYLAFVFGYVYEDADSLLIDNDTLTRCGMHQYNLKVHLRSDATLFVRAASGYPDTTGWLTLQAPLISIHDSSSIIGSGSGYKGGYLNNHPWGYGPGGGGAGGVSGGGGGGGAYGGGGGDGGDEYGGLGGSAYGASQDTVIDMGSGGGAGRLSVVISDGGAGGGAITLRGAYIEIDSSTIESDGQNGDTGGVGLEASGGGSGGSIRMWADTVSLHNILIRANGARGGDAAFGGGGGGGGGRIKVFYVSVLDTAGVNAQVLGGSPGIGDPYLPQATEGNPGSFYVGVHTAIAELATQSTGSISVQPNPVKDAAVISVADVPAHLRVYDAAGRMVMDLCLQERRTRVRFGALGRGVYFLVIDNEGSRSNKLVLIE